jgi:hypothetical protein
MAAKKAKKQSDNKAEAIKKLLEKDPTKPVKEIAKVVGCHPFYVGRIKREMGLTISRQKKKTTRKVTVKKNPVSIEVETLASVPVAGVSAEVKTSYEKREDTPAKPVTTSASLLDTAKKYVTEDRQEDHGDALENFLRTAQYWSVHLGIPIAAHDVAVMMALFKVARIKANPEHVDNWVDGAGYFACGGEVAMRNKFWDEALAALQK